MAKKILESNSSEETEQIGRDIASTLRAGDVVTLSGELGAGKTTMTQGIARELGIEGYVKSPSYTLINVYESGRLPLYHIDLYRIDGAVDLETLGLEEYIYGNGVSVIEWAERIETAGPGGSGDYLPENIIKVTISHDGDDRRRIEIIREDSDERI